MLDAHAGHRAVLLYQADGAGFVEDFHATLLAGFGQRGDQAFAAAPGLDGQTAPELEPAVDLESLAAVDGDEAQALGTHPDHGGKALLDQRLAEIRIGPEAGHAEHVVEEIVFGIDAEVGVGDFILAEVGHHLLQVFDAVVDEADRPGGEPAIAASLGFGRAFQDGDAGALLLCRQCRAHGGIAGADHNHVIAVLHEVFLRP